MTVIAVPFRYGMTILNKNNLPLKSYDLSLLNNLLKSRYNCIIDQGYGKIRGKTFRISNMGDETEETISTLLSNLDSILPEIA